MPNNSCTSQTSVEGHITTGAAWKNNNKCQLLEFECLEVSFKTNKSLFLCPVPFQPCPVCAGSGRRGCWQHQHGHDQSLLHQLSSVPHGRPPTAAHHHHSAVSADEHRCIFTPFFDLFTLTVAAQSWSHFVGFRVRGNFPVVAVYSYPENT